MFGIWTLDSHEYYGPFLTVLAAHRFAKELHLTSYQIGVFTLQPFEHRLNWRISK